MCCTRNTKAVVLHFFDLTFQETQGLRYLYGPVHLLFSLLFQQRIIVSHRDCIVVN